MFYKNQDSRRFVLFTAMLCIIGMLLITITVLANTYESYPDTFIFLQNERTEEIADVSAECIYATIALLDQENDNIYRDQIQQPIDKDAITNLVYKPPICTDYNSAKPKILAENGCGTWYVKISIPNDYHEPA